MKKRVVIMRLVFVLMGAVLNVTVAWTLAIFVPVVIPEDYLDLTYCSDADVPDDDVQAHVRAWAERNGCSLLSPTHAGACYVQHVSYAKSRGVMQAAVIDVKLQPDGTWWMSWIGDHHPSAHYVEAGWPAKALVGGLVIDRDSQAEAKVNSLMYGFSNRVGHMPYFTPERRVGARRVAHTLLGIETPPLRLLPLRPSWPGFVVNTLLYTLMLVLFLTGVTAVCQRGHRWRGRCSKCAYDLRGDLTAGCPECGWGRRVRCDA